MAEARLTLRAQVGTASGTVADILERSGEQPSTAILYVPPGEEAPVSGGTLEYDAIDASGGGVVTMKWPGIQVTGPRLVERTSVGINSFAYFILDQRYKLQDTEMSMHENLGGAQDTSADKIYRNLFESAGVTFLDQFPASLATTFPIIDATNRPIADILRDLQLMTGTRIGPRYDGSLQVYATGSGYAPDKSHQMAAHLTADIPLPGSVKITLGNPKYDMWSKTYPRAMSAHPQNYDERLLIDPHLSSYFEVDTHPWFATPYNDSDANHAGWAARTHFMWFQCYKYPSLVPTAVPQDDNTAPTPDTPPDDWSLDAEDKLYSRMYFCKIGVNNPPYAGSSRMPPYLLTSSVSWDMLALRSLDRPVEYGGRITFHRDAALFETDIPIYDSSQAWNYPEAWGRVAGTLLSGGKALASSITVQVGGTAPDITIPVGGDGPVFIQKADVAIGADPLANGWRVMPSAEIAMARSIADSWTSSEAGYSMEMSGVVLAAPNGRVKSCRLRFGGNTIPMSKVQVDG